MATEDVDVKARETAAAAQAELKQETSANVPQKIPLVAGGGLKAIIPQDFDQAFKLARVIVAAGMNTKSLDSVEKVCVAILHGMEVGLTPMASVQSIAVINGMPSIWGDGMLALIKSSGLLEDCIEELESDDSGPLIATCKVKRKGDSRWIAHSFSRADAMKAGLWKKQGPWQNYPGRMMQWRAKSWAYRDAFPDVLRGLVSAVEVDDMLDVGSVSIVPPAAEPKRRDFDRARAAGAAQDVEQERAPDHPAADLPAHDADGVIADPRQNYRVEALGQDAIIKAIEDAFALALSPAVVDYILEDNDDRIQKFGAVKKSNLLRVAQDRKLTLEQKARERADQSGE